MLVMDENGEEEFLPMDGMGVWWGLTPTGGEDEDGSFE
jgi:hypothetical protein